MNNLPTSPYLNSQNFSEHLLTWFEQHGRHDLPWQVNDDPYKVWVSEIMLQQTQVKTVLQYFERFMQRFPTVQDLGNAHWDEVAPYWAGLGYYARARNLHKAAGIVAIKGEFPKTLEEWVELSGVGPSTAGALMSLGLRQFGVIMDGNVKRVLSRFLALEGDSTSSAFIKNIWKVAETLTPQTRAHDYNQAIMDLGATICTPKKPLCLYCPMQSDCAAFKQNRVLELPQKPARKAKPTRHAAVLLIQHNQQLLWQQRPPEGLWGGLWSLPVIDSDIELTLVTLKLTNGAEGKKIRHTFTHFHWELQAFHFEIDAKQKKTLEAYFVPTRWMNDVEAFAAGVPEAMRKLLKISVT
jgi:A/G-specific adenine glycosylase